MDGDATETVSGQDGTLGMGTAMPTDTTDRFGTPGAAMFFNGDDLIEIPSEGLTNNEFSVSAWVLVSQNPGSLQMDYYAIGDDAEDQVFGVSNDMFGAGFFQAGYVDVGAPIRVFADGLPVENEWYHVVFTRSLTQLKLYVNSQLIDSTDATGTLPVYGTDPLAFIGNRNVNLRPWHGVIDDLRIWDVALTQAEVDLVNGISVITSSLFTITPNPTNGPITVSGVLPGSTLIVHDASGRLVRTFPVTSDPVRLDLSDLSAGSYVIDLLSHGRDGQLHVTVTDR